MSVRIRYILFCLDFFGINALFRFLNRQKAVILWYHGICEDDFQLLKGYDERHIPKSVFENQIRYLNQKRYHFVTMTELVDALKQSKDIRKFVVLTFDDGFRNVVENAYPIMNQFKAKGCFYLVSGLIGKKELLWTDYVETVVRNSKKGEFLFEFNGKTITYQLDTKESFQNAMRDIKEKLRTIPDAERKEHLKQFAKRVLDTIPQEFEFSTWEQIQSLDKNILEVGSHTVNHPNCANLTSDIELENEIKNSRLAIEQRVGYPIHHFCYPAGSYNDEVIKNVKKYQYASAATIHPGFNDTGTDLYKLRRILACTDMFMFKAMVSGSYQFLSSVIQRLKRL